MKNLDIDAPKGSPIDPIELTLDDTIQFQCHRGVACFNKCCESIDITLTPYDIMRLKRRLDLTSREFVAIYTVPYQMDAHGMPGLKLITQPGSTACVFLKKEGCSVYEDRPTACRYYALGSMGLRKKDAGEVEDIYFLVKEDHCQGHSEPRTLTVREYRTEQGVGLYDEMNKQWRDIVLKKRSAGPAIGTPTPRSMQLFDMCSYDMDSFRDFIQSLSFRAMFDVEDAVVQQLVGNEDELLHFAMRFLKQVLFGEQTIPLQEGAREKRVAERKDVWEERKRAEIERFRERDVYEDNE